MRDMTMSQAFRDKENFDRKIIIRCFAKTHLSHNLVLVFDFPLSLKSDLFPSWGHNVKSLYCCNLCCKGKEICSCCHRKEMKLVWATSEDQKLKKSRDQVGYSQNFVRSSYEESFLWCKKQIKDILSPLMIRHSSIIIEVCDCKPNYSYEDI